MDINLTTLIDDEYESLHGKPAIKRYYDTRQHRYRTGLLIDIGCLPRGRTLPNLATVAPDLRSRNADYMLGRIRDHLDQFPGSTRKAIAAALDEQKSVIDYAAWRGLKQGMFRQEKTALDSTGRPNAYCLYLATEANRHAT